MCNKRRFYQQYDSALRNNTTFFIYKTRKNRKYISYTRKNRVEATSEYRTLPISLTLENIRDSLNVTTIQELIARDLAKIEV